MLLTNSVMRSKQPRLQVGECNVDHWQVGIGSFGVAVKHQGFVRVAQFRQIIVAPPSIGAHNSSLGDILLHEFREFLGSTTRHEAQAQSAGIDNSLVLLAFLDGHPRAYLDGPNDRRLMVDATPLAFCTTAHKRLIDFDWMLGSDRVALRPHHTGTQLVEHLKRRLVARQSKLALKLQSRLAGRLRRHEVCTPEPYRQRRVTVLHDGVCRERHVGLADSASQDDRCSLGEPVRGAAIPALRAGKPVRPSQVLKVLCASRFIGEYPLKLGKRRRETTKVHAGNLASGLRFGNQPDRQGSNKWDHFCPLAAVRHHHLFYYEVKSVSVNFCINTANCASMLPWLIFIFDNSIVFSGNNS